MIDRSKYNFWYTRDYIDDGVGGSPMKEIYICSQYRNEPFKSATIHELMHF